MSLCRFTEPADYMLTLIAYAQNQALFKHSNSMELEVKIMLLIFVYIKHCVCEEQRFRKACDKTSTTLSKAGLFNPFKPNGISHTYQLDQSMSVLRVVRLYFSFLSNSNRSFCKQTVETLIRRHILRRLQGLHFLPMSHKMEARLKWVKHLRLYYWLPQRNDIL